MKLFKWFAGFFEDQAGSASSKRAALYICLIYLGYIVIGNLNGKSVDIEVLMVVAGVILFCLGAVTGEFFTMFNKNKDKADGSKPQ